MNDEAAGNSKLTVHLRDMTAQFSQAIAASASVYNIHNAGGHVVDPPNLQEIHLVYDLYHAVGYEEHPTLFMLI